MKIAVVGAGPAGSYLARRLHGSGFDVRLFERQPRDGFRCVCAWGTEERPLSEFARRCGLQFEDYVLRRGRKMQVETSRGPVELDVEGLCTFEKERFLRDLREGVPASFGTTAAPRDLAGFDLAVDATGPFRALLPPIEGDTKAPCLQHTVEYAKPPFEDFYVKPFPDASGYLWYFPLDRNRAHVGAGSLTPGLFQDSLREFMERHPGKVVETAGKQVRLSAPRRCRPFSAAGSPQGGRGAAGADPKDKPPVVGVGESIGTVMPTAGEGIQWSLRCAELLFGCIQDRWDPVRYETRVLREFRSFAVYDRLGRAARERSRGKALLWGLAMLPLGVKPRFLTDLSWREMFRLARRLGWS